MGRSRDRDQRPGVTEPHKNNARPCLKVTPNPAFSISAHLAAGRERLSDRHAIGIFKIAAHGQTAGDPGNAHPERQQLPLHLEGGGFPLERWIGRQNDLRDAFGFDSNEEIADGQIVGPDAVQR